MMINPTIEKLAVYLGRDSSIFLGEEPFKSWEFKRSIESDLEHARIDYVASKHGIDIVCDERGKIRTFFLYFNQERRFRHGLPDAPFELKRRQVLEIFGVPSRSGPCLDDPVLGKIGAWDRFQMAGHSVHFQYIFDGDDVCLITLMRSDCVPAP